MCTVLFRFSPGRAWPVLLCAVRDEFLDRSWRPPGRHWDGPYRHLHGPLDETAGGTWLAVDPARPAVAVLVNGDEPGPGNDGCDAGGGQTRGRLPLRALVPGTPLDSGELTGTRGFHLLLAEPAQATVWGWDTERLVRHRVEPGDHTLSFHGLDVAEPPRVPHVRALLAATPSPAPAPGTGTADAWGDWLDLLAAGGVGVGDPRSLLQRRQLDGRRYGSTSASLVALGPGGVRHDFTGEPFRQDSWYESGPGRPAAPTGRTDPTGRSPALDGDPRRPRESRRRRRPGGDRHAR
ncbi:NRDE family protein [Plantactinospora sonchi]|uniref:NRDE family protein n=1 Tax=Plantactinospora sonchi TaxID=1544735 RepID=A0ABU7RQB7_9ACTN